jgi:hypothetical protein
MLDILYCDKCKYNLCKNDEFIFEFFQFIVENYFNESPLEVSTNNQDFTHEYLAMIGFLEKRNYVVSTESSHDLIRVKPLGFYKKWQNTPICCFCPPEEPCQEWD